LHPFFQGFMRDTRNDCPKCQQLYPRLISLPLYPAMSEQEVQYVADSVREIVMQFRQTKVSADSCRYPISPEPAEQWSQT
jgi:hypothetical protein